MNHAYGTENNPLYSLGRSFSSDAHPLFRAKDPISALTHFIGCVLSVVAMPFLIIQAAEHIHDRLALICVSVFMLSMVFLYGASTAYHTFTLTEQAGKTLKKLDHCMIFILIAGSYTPICMLALRDTSGPMLLAVVWGVTIVGILFKLCWVTCPRWVSSVIYIIMGWLCVLSFRDILHSLPMSSFLWLLIGGIVYTVGGVVYSLKLRLFKGRFPQFGIHELFHIFVMIGSFCHYICVYLLVASV